jgi:hypothetical protein
MSVNTQLKNLRNDVETNLTCKQPVGCVAEGNKLVISSSRLKML